MATAYVIAFHTHGFKPAKQPQQNLNDCNAWDVHPKTLGRDC